MNRIVERAVVVTCLGHSGSTLLDLILGGHPRIIGLGEVFATMGNLARQKSEKSENVCTCGRPQAECPFWGPVAHRIRSGPCETHEERYGAVLRTFAERFGPGQIPVDISKNPSDRLRSLKTIRSVSPGTDIRVLHLVKDVRAYAISRMDRDREKGKTRRPSLVLFWRWYAQNRRIQRDLERAGARHMVVSYDELCLEPATAIRRLTDFLELDPEPAMAAISETHSHTLRGNRMRREPEKNRAILYDYRWLYRNEWVLPAALSPHIMRYNARMAYGNLNRSRWENRGAGR